MYVCVCMYVFVCQSSGARDSITNPPPAANPPTRMVLLGGDRRDRISHTHTHTHTVLWRGE